MAFAWDVSADVARHDDALDWFGKRTVITSADARKLDARTKADAFWVGGGLQIAQVQRVFDEINVAIEKGESLAEFKTRVKGLLSDPAHIETVFRNATQRAYNAGRYAQMKEPSTAKFRPWFLFDAVLDSRTSAICEACNGTLLPHDDPWWDSRIPPLHHRCRSSIRNLRASEAAKRKAKALPSADDSTPADGWGTSPALATQWKPDPDKHDASLIAALKKKAPKGEKTRQPAPKPYYEAKFWRSKYAHYAEGADSLAEGAAAYERGLDMTVAAARKELQKIDAPGVKSMLDALEDADAERTMREQTGQTDPLRKVAAALAGHLRDLPARAAVTHAGLAKNETGRAALAFFSRVTGPGIKHPEGYSFRVVKKRAEHKPVRKLITYRAKADGSLEHEWGHALESLNPELLKRARAFWATRTAGLKHRRLRNVFPGHGYKADEIAIEDGFAHIYIGKDYGPGATEITSMGLDVLFAGRSNWGRLGELAQKDFEHLLFLIGQLKGT